MANEISISDSIAKYRLCVVCRSDIDVRELTFAYDNGTFRQGTQLTLCKKCRKELLALLKGADDDTD